MAEKRKLHRLLHRLRLSDLAGLDVPEVEEPKRPGPGLAEGEGDEKDE